MSGLRNIPPRAAVDDGAREEAVREDAFQRRTRSQKHLRLHGPLLRALIRIAGSLDVSRSPGELERRVQEARALAVKVASVILGKPEESVEVDEAVPYRHECAEAVAWAWTSGRPVKAEAFVAEMVAAVRIAQSASEPDAVPWKQMTPKGTMAMTVLPAVMRLRRVVDAYDFRLGRDEVTAYLAAILDEAASEAVQAILPPGATVADRRSLYQSVLREYSNDLRVIYEQAARRAVTHMLDLDEGDRVRYLHDVRPLENLAAAFRGVAQRNTALNLAAVQVAMGDVPSPDRRVDTEQPGP